MRSDVMLCADLATLVLLWAHGDDAWAVGNLADGALETTSFGTTSGAGSGARAVRDDVLEVEGLTLLPSCLDDSFSLLAGVSNSRMLLKILMAKSWPLGLLVSPGYHLA